MLVRPSGAGLIIKGRGKEREKEKAKSSGRKIGIRTVSLVLGG